MLWVPFQELWNCYESPSGNCNESPLVVSRTSSRTPLGNCYESPFGIIFYGALPIGPDTLKFHSFGVVLTVSFFDQKFGWENLNST